jgi:pimeloyl-ACP methyl ester carboxylesterase
MGGAVALRFTFMYPDAVKSLTLIDSYGAIKTPSALDEVIKVSGKNTMLDITSADDYKAMMNYAMVDPPYIPGFLIDVLAEAKIKRKTIEQKMLKDMAVDADQTAVLAEIHAPTLILWGKQDRVLHVDNAGLLQEKIPGSRRVLFEQTGHVPMVEKPKETAQNFRNFLKEVATTAPNISFEGGGPKAARPSTLR